MWLVEKIKEICLRLERKWILRKVSKDKTIEKKEVPDEVHDAIFEEIRRMEEEWERERQMIEQLSNESKELIRLGKVYKRNLHYRKYSILAAILVLTLAMGITSFGSVGHMFHKITSMICGRTRENFDSDGVRVLDDQEESVYAEIEEMYGVYPVRMTYLPDGIKLLESSIMQDVPKINLIYGTNEQVCLVYDISFGCREGSWSKDIEDEMVDQYIVFQNDVEINIKEFSVKNATRWLIQFSYRDSYYKIQVANVSREEMNTIVEYLYFL